jgi:hypothetical protein
LDKHLMDVDTAETIAGVVRLLRQAAVLVWAAADRAGAGSPVQLFALGMDLAADQARHLVPDGTDIWARGCGLWTALELIMKTNGVMLPKIN